MQDSPAVGKVLTILDAFGSGQPDFTLGALARQSALPKTTVHRLLAVLEKWGGVEQTRTGAYRLGPKLSELFELVEPQMRLRSAALPFMEKLLLSAGVCVDLVEIRSDGSIFVEHLGPPGAGGSPPGLMTRRAVCRVVLAFNPSDTPGPSLLRRGSVSTFAGLDLDSLVADLDIVRDSGVACEHAHARSGAFAVACPIFDGSSSVVGVISASGHTDRGLMAAMISAVRVSAFAVSRELG